MIKNIKHKHHHSRKTSKIIILFILIIFIFLNIPCYSQNADQSTIPADLSGTIQIDSFQNNSRITGQIDFFINSSENLNIIIFLPSTVGSWWAEESYIPTESKSKLFFSEKNFNGSFYSNGYFFPWDNYELTFIFGFNKEVKIQNDTVTSYFGDSLLYTNWKLVQDSELIVDEDDLINSGLVNKIAVGNDDVVRLSNRYNLTSFYAINILTYRVGVNFSRALLTCFAPGIILFVILTYFFRVKEKDLGHSIALYTGISFFLAAYLFTIRSIIPPILTIVELIILFEIAGCLLLLIFHPKIFSPSNHLLKILGTILMIFGFLITIYNGIINGSIFFGIGGLFLCIVYKRHSPRTSQSRKIKRNEKSDVNS